MPFADILEICEFDPSDLMSAHQSHVTEIRGESHATVALRDLLDLPKDEAKSTETIHGVLIGSKVGSLCLLVDRVFGHRKIVVRGLNEVLPGMDKFAGVAELGAGELALVLSAPDLIACARNDAKPVEDSQQETSEAADAFD